MNRQTGKSPNQRKLRVGEELRHALAQIMERTEFRDPGLEGVFVTITEVRVSPDLRNATVFVIPLGGVDVGPVVAGLNRIKSFLRREVSHMVRLQYSPNLSFEPDRSFENAQHIEALLHSPEVLRDVGGNDDGEA
ncbi:MAG: 30S ribosome-binding factor RbfA [Alphaproteobacteria bacterium]|nr:30S ribosome-binding factor RbfA [Alphaproteobacteria bacterium]